MYKFISSAVLCMALALPVMAAEYEIEISLETAPAHIRNPKTWWV